MTRIKEPPIGTSEVPKYKSPPSRVIQSLRLAYDNIRTKLAERSQTVLALQGKLRDTQESRDEWKKRAKAAEAQVLNLGKNIQTEKKRKTILKKN